MPILQKSPLNEAVGKLVSSLRDQRRLSPSSIAEDFHISQAYLRSIEAGSRALPAYTAIALVNSLGMSWIAASSLVSLVSFLDTRKEDRYDIKELHTRVQSLRAKLPQFNALFISLLEAISLKEEGDDKAYASKLEVLVTILQKELDPPQQLSTSRDVRAPTPRMNRHGLSPVFEDIIDAVADRLAMLTPQFNRSGAELWEKKHAHRIKVVYGYMPDIHSLSQAIKDFDWAFMRNAYAPSLTILVPKATKKHQSEIIEGLIKKLTSMPANQKEIAAQELAKRVSVLDCTPYQVEVDKCLTFDPFASSLISNHLKTEAISPREITNKADTAWIYELEPEYVPPGVYIAAIKIGILSTLGTARQTGQAVSIPHEHIAMWIEIFNKFQSQASSL